MPGMSQGQDVRLPDPPPRGPIVDLFDWTPSPPSPAEEQREIPLPGTIADRYRAWRETDEGRLVYRWCRDRAVQDAQDGARRIGSKALVERCRWMLKVKVNNIFTAELAREIQERNPVTRGLFEMRQRRSA